MEKEVTIIITQRNLFSTSSLNLNSVFNNTDIPFDLLYIDAGSPHDIQQYLLKESKQRKFQYCRSEKFMPPNLLRRKGLDLIHTRFALFLDNDCTVSRGWLKQLIHTAKETKAWLVAPLYLENIQGQIQVHMMGGKAGLVRQETGNWYFLKPNSPHLPESECDIPSSPFETELIEYHCLLVDLSQFPEKPPIDERLYSMHEHNDLCLYVSQQGGKIVIDPRVKVTFLVPPPFKWHDLPVYFVRWSEKWNRSSTKYFKEKWNLSDGDPFIRRSVFYGSMMRRNYLLPARNFFRKWFGRTMTSLIFKYFIYPVEKRINMMLVYKDPGSRPVNLVEFNLTSTQTMP